MLPGAEGQTLNTGGAGGGEASATPATDSSAVDLQGGHMPTMPEDMIAFPASAETLNTGPEGGQQQGEAGTTDGGGDKSKATGAADGGGAGGDKGDGTTEPFHKHPRFQELIGKNKTLEQQVKSLAQQLELMASGKGGDGGVKPGGSDPVAEAERQRAAIQEDMDEGKLSFSEGTKRLQAVSDKLNEYKVQAALQAQAREVEAAKIQENFLKEHSDFIELRDSGKLQEVMDSNPLHDPLSAYFALKAQGVDAAVKVAVEKAVKETEERLRKEFQSKRNAASLGAGSAHVPNAGDTHPALQDTKKFGGRTAVLAEMLKGMRARRQ